MAKNPTWFDLEEAARLKNIVACVLLCAVPAWEFLLLLYPTRFTGPMILIDLSIRIWLCSMFQNELHEYLPVFPNSLSNKILTAYLLVPLEVGGLIYGTLFINSELAWLLGMFWLLRIPAAVLSAFCAVVAGEM